jgi:MerR family transcriptional regulator, redox-sensitive transcriptional activator SoxR
MTSYRSGDVRATPDDWLSIGEVSARTGAAVSALRFYEELGLIASERDDRNQRRYPRHMLRRIALISVAKRLCIPLQDLREAFAEPPGVAARFARLETPTGGAPADHRAA